MIIEFKDNIDFSLFKLKINDEIIEFKTNLIGKYNIYNLLNTIIVLDKIGINIDKIKEIVSLIEEPPGRLEKIKLDRGIVIIDYAHTPDAVEKVIKCIRNVSDGLIYTVIGCGGNRDKKKRPIMGDIATSLSDYVIFTSDNPRCEEPLSIINNIIQNLDKKNYEIEENREIAIIKGIQKLDKNDILLVLGKGHEDYQIIGNEKIYFSDKEIVLNNRR